MAGKDDHELELLGCWLFRGRRLRQVNGAIKMRAHNSLATMKAPEPEAGGAQNSGFGSDIITAITRDNRHSHARIIRPPIRNGFLDVGAAELFIECALEKGGKFRV